MPTEIQELTDIWNGYTELEFRWLEIVLARSVICKKDLLELFDQFEISFPEADWRERITPCEMGNYLLATIEREHLLEKVKKIVCSKYKHKFAFSEAESLYNKLEQCDKELLRKMYLALSNDTKMRNFILSDKNLNHCSTCQLVFFILEEMYKR